MKRLFLKDCLGLNKVKRTYDFTVTRTTTWSDGQVLTAAALNGEFNNLGNSTSIVNADISGSAGIAISKISTGVSGSLVGTTDTQTLSSKRITKRVETIADGTTIAPSWDSNDISKQINTQVSGTLTISNPTYTTANDGDLREIMIKSTNSQTYSFGTSYKGGTTALPATHAGSSQWDLLLFQYSSTDSNWKLVALVTAVS